MKLFRVVSISILQYAVVWRIWGRGSFLSYCGCKVVVQYFCNICLVSYYVPSCHQLWGIGYLSWD